MERLRSTKKETYARDLVRIKLKQKKREWKVSPPAGKIDRLIFDVKLKPPSQEKEDRKGTEKGKEEEAERRR